MAVGRPPTPALLLVLDIHVHVGAISEHIMGSGVPIFELGIGKNK